MRVVKSFQMNRSLREHKRFVIEVPRGSRFLHVDLERDVLWFECENSIEREARTFHLYYPDESIALDFEYRKTINGRSRETTMHLYEKRR